MNNPPAFPVLIVDRPEELTHFNGMTLRDYFAAKAMQKILPDSYEMPKKIDPIFFRTVETLKFNTRITNCLKAKNIFYIKDLIRETDYSLSKVENLGHVSLQEIIDGLNAVGLHLGWQFNEINSLFFDEVACISYAVADAMLKAREI
jgi:DNA-directed RNA polymerase alpha subunit